MRQAIVTAALVLGGLWLWQGPVKAYREKHRCDGLGEAVMDLPTQQFQRALAKHSQGEINYCLERWPSRPASR